MPDAQTIYELRAAFQKPGCPICTFIQRVSARYIEGTFNESLLDPTIRQKLVDSLGFCYEHIWLSLNLKLSDALGHAILSRDLVKTTLKTIIENENNAGDRLASSLDPVATCPACRIEEATVERVIDSMKVALRDQEFITAYTQSNGLCISHLKRLLPGLDVKRRAVILDHQRICMEQLLGELSEFIRKSDYRFRDEIIGKEGDSYLRAADMIQGKRRPSEKKDLR
jgi:hypothetical protein